MADWDVIVVGGGNAALCAALSAKETAKRVLVLERAPEAEAGGNSRFTAGLMRIVYNGADDLGRLIELSREEIERTDFGTYTADQFLDDMARVTEYRCDPDLTEILVKESFSAALWMRKQGLRFTAAWGRQAFKIEGRSSSGAALRSRRSAAVRGWSSRSRRSRRSAGSRSGTRLERCR